MSIELKSFNQILGDMIRKILSETPLSDINAGSVLLSLLEACASNDFENNVAILNILELLNIDAVRNSDLDSRAGDYGLTRYVAQKAIGFVKITNTNITKQSTGLYVIKPAPISGQTTLYVNNTDGWSPTGNLYIGRGTENFEGPIPYTAITVFPTFSKIDLGAALQKDHLSSDTVINSQGQPDRVISAGTIVKILANNENPDVLYVTLRDAVLPSGEDSVDNIQVIAVVPGSAGNALINTVTQFETIPFSGAAVVNTSSFSSGTDIETDVQLRNRIKAYSTTLARGTAPSIISAVKGVSDPVENKQVVSAVITEPVSIGDPSILYIDDGTGFQPSYAGQSVDILLANANGTEQYLQLANFPLPRPQVVNAAVGPYELSDSQLLRVSIDEVEETVVFTASDFINISAATVSEIVVAINAKATSFKARLTNESNNILIYPVVHDAEIIQVSALKTTDDPTLYANAVLKFPTNEFSYIALYQNSDRLHEKAKSASVETTPFANWGITASGNIVITVDGTPAQDRTFALSDFIGATSFAALTLDDWVTVFNDKLAGLTAVATASQTMKITSNKVGDESMIEVLSGSYFDKWFNEKDTTSQGQSAQFELNRQTGNLNILTEILPGDNISAGVEDAKGFVVSVDTLSGVYNFSNDAAGRPAEVVLVTDSTSCDQVSIQAIIGGSITVSDEGSSVMRIMADSLSMFSAMVPGDYLYITKKTASWLSDDNTGLFKLVAKGKHTTVNVDSYVEVLNNVIVAESAIIDDVKDIRGFRTDGYPQIWRASYLNTPASEPIDNVVASFNEDVLGVHASVFRSKSIKLTSTTELNGNIAVPITNGNASAVFTETQTAQFGNLPHIANRVASKSLFSYFKRSPSAGSPRWLDRYVYDDIKGPLTANANPDAPPFSGTYSELVTSAGVLNQTYVGFNDLIAFTRGDNRGQIRSIKALLAGDQAGTQQGTPRTELDHVVGDEFEIVKSLQLSSDDSVVFIMDQDPTDKTVDIKMSRTGEVNSGSNALSFLPTTTQFSANDYDNEPGIDFGNVNIWGTTLNKTDFSDYSLWMRARNWYASGGVAGTDGKMIVRANQYGPNGEKLRFNIIYPTKPLEAASTVLRNFPSYTQLSYIFGSSSERAVALSTGDTISVAGPYPDDSTNFPSGAPSTGDYYDYTFSAGSFGTVTAGDVISIRPMSGISPSNSGQFSVAAVSGNTIRVFNPNASVTTPGSPEIITVTTVADFVGSPSSYLVDTVADVAGSLDGTYFIIQDTSGSVAVWFDLNNGGTPEPAHGASRSIKIASVNTNDSATVIATKIYNYIVLDNAFSASGFGNQINISNKLNGALAAGSAGTSGFTVMTTTGVNDNSVNGKYFIIYDAAGSVAVWFDVDNRGTPEPFHGADRSIKVFGVTSGMSATNVAAAVVQVVNPDASFTASNVGAVITITNTFDGNVPAALIGTSGFTVSSANGSLTTAEPIANPGLINIFPLTGTTVAQIATTVNAGNVIKLVAVGSDSLTITKSTEEEIYAYGGNSTALGYGHNPLVPADRDHIALYDGANWVKSFQNANPNFTLKKALILNGVAPSVYQMDTAPNPDITELGELFKLIPTTVKNVYHHFTQKALSQLPIVSTIDISNAGKNVQVKSKLLGSAGSVEVVGGRANSAQIYTIGESSVSTDSSGNFLNLKVPAFPDTINVGDVLRVENDAGVRRLSKLDLNDSFNVTIPAINLADYNYNPKAINVSSGTVFTIADVSGSYGVAAGTVWRWTHDGSGPTFADVIPGDVLTAFGTLTGWAQGNKARTPGDARVAGLPIIAVNDAADWIDVANPYGKAMGGTAIGSGTVQICPTPIVKWNLKHAARVTINAMSRTSNVVSVQCTDAHFLNSGDTVDIIDSDNVPDGQYSNVTVTSASTFTFALAGANFTEANIGASILNAASISTRYRIEKLGFNGLVRLSRQDGNSPGFADCGVAVDDYLVISGNTFNTNNTGRFRVLAVDNNAVVYINELAKDELNTIKKFNAKGLQAAWTANSNVITGVAGTFKNVLVGDWIKKAEDDDSKYVQVLAMFPSTPSLATTVTLGANYGGTSSGALGITYDQSINYDKGVYLMGNDDIAVYEGDAAVIGDELFVQNIINTNWFDPKNSGTFDLIEVGTNASTYKPFVRVNNPIALVQSNRLMSVNTEGLFITESAVNKFYTMREVFSIAIDELNPERRVVFLSPASRSYKFSEANGTSVTHLGKMNYSTDVTTGVDGYLYYTGLLRKVQYIVDGFEPDSNNFPGRRAVGGAIETLPPLSNSIVIALDVTTDEGINLGDISNNIKSVVINYINGLGVGDDVILSEIIASVMGVKGVGAVTFTTPAPSIERITIADNEKATILPENIGIA